MAVLLDCSKSSRQCSLPYGSGMEHGHGAASKRRRRAGRRAEYEAGGWHPRVRGGDAISPSIEVACLLTYSFFFS